MVKKIGTRFLCSVMVASLILLNNTNNCAMAKGKENGRYTRKITRYSQNCAEDIARNQVYTVVNEASEKGKWDEKIQIRKKSLIYDVQKQLCAYAFDLQKDGREAGYVIVGANDKYPPIIEYAMNGQFLDDSVSLQEDEYLVYDGGVGYYKVREETSDAMNIHSKKEVRFDELRTVAQDRMTDFSGDWEMMEKAVQEGTTDTSIEAKEIHNGGITTVAMSNLANNVSNKILSTSSANGPILVPREAEENGDYISASHAEVPCYAYVNYLDMSIRPDDPNQTYTHYCVPIAATNLLMYWHERKYYDLMYGGSWKASFERLHSIMGGNSASKNLAEVPCALETYLNTFGITNANIRFLEVRDFAENKKKYDKVETNALKAGLNIYDYMALHPNNEAYKAVDEMWEFMKNEIREGAPFLFTPWDHTYYSNVSVDETVNHQLLALGYQEFKYNGIQVASERNYSAYLLVEDSWSNRPDRYVNLTVGSNYLDSDFMTLYFIGK